MCGGGTRPVRICCWDWGFSKAEISAAHGQLSPFACVHGAQAQNCSPIFGITHLKEICASWQLSLNGQTVPLIEVVFKLSICFYLHYLLYFPLSDVLFASPYLLAILVFSYKCYNE